MNTFADFKIKKPLLNALADLGLSTPSPIQQESYAPILGGSDFVGIAQTGTGKTIAYLLPILQDLTFSEEKNPRVLVLAPTRELVIQIAGEIEKLTAYMNVRVLAVYGGSSNMMPQKQAVAKGVDIVVGTPQRVYDLALSTVLRLKTIKKLVIDEVDIMLDFGYKTQLKNIFEYLPAKRQNVLFSATMTTYVDQLTNEFLVNAVKKTIAVSGTPLENIKQEAYAAPNFYSKANLVAHLVKDKDAQSKILIFVSSKVGADRLFEILSNVPAIKSTGISVIHGGKEQSHRTKSIEKFESGTTSVLIATDVIARGIDIDKITTVISFDTPFYPENYIHRIGRTGRAKQQGKAILFYNEKEKVLKDAIEGLMNYTIPLNAWPSEVKISSELTPEEKDKPIEPVEKVHKKTASEAGPSHHPKSAKNSKPEVKKKSYSEKMKEKFKKPIRRGDKIQNMKKKNKGK